MAGPRDGQLWATLVAGLELRADDGPFAAGTGPLVTGSTLALVMAMAGQVFRTEPPKIFPDSGSLFPAFPGSFFPFSSKVRLPSAVVKVSRR